MNEKSCPLCKKILSLQQINLNLAVYICDDLKCKYPVGFDCIVVERKLEDMNKNLGFSKDSDLNDWVRDVVVESNESSQPVTINIPQNGGDKTQEGTEWIDNLVEEAVNEARKFEASKEDKSESIDTDFDEILNFL